MLVKTGEEEREWGGSTNDGWYTLPHDTIPYAFTEHNRTEQRTESRCPGHTHSHTSSSVCICETLPGVYPVCSDFVCICVCVRACVLVRMFIVTLVFVVGPLVL